MTEQSQKNWEKERLNALHEYGILDAPAEPELQALLRVAADIAGVPTAAINIIDADQQCQFTMTDAKSNNTPRDDSMCATSIAIGGFVISPDATEDPRFSANPWVDGRMASVRFYAAAPLLTPKGYPLGTLCVFDPRPSSLSQDQIDRLDDLTSLVIALFERRRQARAQEQLAYEADLARQELALAHKELVSTAEELQRSNEELQQLAAVASHDLASPLTVISGYLQLLEDTYGESIDPNGLQWISICIDATHRMHDLITSLLEYAKIGNDEVRLKATDTHKVFDQVLTDVNTSLKSARATVGIEGELPVVECDPTQIRQLMQNLISNAVKSRRPDVPSRVVISAELSSKVDYSGEKFSEWIFTVADNGPGIPREQRDRVFRMFERLAATKSTQGTGIGLATCERIVNRHRGRIWIEDSEIGGTAIRFTIPIGA